MITKSFNVEKSPVKNWDEVLTNPQPITVETLKTGTVIINKKGALNPEHPLNQDINDEELEVPILSYIIHHESGDYLLDAGLDKSYYKDPLGGIKTPLADEFIQGMNQNIKFQIEKKKISLKTVFLSHLHPDHMAGIRELPTNIPYVIGEGELDYFKPELIGDFLKNVQTLCQINFANLNKLSPLGFSADILGDGSLWVIQTPGHTPGHMSFFINSTDEPLLFAMDACFIKENITRKIAPSSYTWNVKLAQETLNRIIKFKREYPQVKIRCGHETP